MPLELQQVWIMRLKKYPYFECSFIMLIKRFDSVFESSSDKLSNQN